MERRLLLASQSPRRRDLLKLAGVEFDVCISHVEESGLSAQPPEQMVQELARRKARHVLQAHPGHVVLGADTVVCLEGKVFGKPKDARHAKQMLLTLSGRTHQVYTGFCVASLEREECGVETTDVTFFPLADELIDRYIATGEPFDKAGGYGIQGKGCVLVQSITGDYYNVIGLPIARVVRLLATF